MIDYKELNRIYYSLDTKKKKICKVLSKEKFSIEYGYYNGHYNRSDSGDFIMDYYPIPVISVKDLCDVEINLDRLSISSKLKRETALVYSFENFQNIKFEVFGVEDYLADYYHEGKTIEEMKESISQSDEDEIAFDFYFDFDIDVKDVLDFIKFLQTEGFYY